MAKRQFFETDASLSAVALGLVYWLRCYSLIQPKVPPGELPRAVVRVHVESVEIASAL
jgi:hypothetical protein